MAVDMSPAMRRHRHLPVASLQAGQLIDRCRASLAFTGVIAVLSDLSVPTSYSDNSGVRVHSTWLGRR